MFQKKAPPPEGGYFSETPCRTEEDEEKDHRKDTEPPTDYLQRDCVSRHTRLPPPENNDERKRYGTLCDTDRACVPNPPIQRKKLHGYREDLEPPLGLASWVPLKRQYAANEKMGQDFNPHASGHNGCRTSNIARIRNPHLEI